MTGSIPPDSTLTEAPELSCMDLISDPCFPIKLIACVDATNNRMEQIVSPADPLISLSVSDNPETRLNILNTASIAGEIAASSSSFPDISIYKKITTLNTKRNRYTHI
jgi:hypothetical protein